MNLNEDYIFDEKAFKEWLNNDSSQVFQINPDYDRYSRGKRFSKININEEYSLLFLFDPYYYGELKSIHSSQYGLEFKAIYFNKINTIVYDENYYIGNLKELCKDIQIISFDKIYEEMFKKINAEFNTRIPTLKEYFKNEIELIEEKKKTNKNEVFKHLTGYKEDSTTNYLSEYRWNDIKNRELAYQYLTNKDDFIVQYVDSYLKEENYLENIKHTTCYLIAYDEIVSDVLNTKEFKRGKFINDLVKNELNGAKKVWIGRKNNKEIQVENRFYSFDFEVIKFGDYRGATYYEDIEYIRYGKKEFPLPQFND